MKWRFWKKDSMPTPEVEPPELMGSVSFEEPAAAAEAVEPGELPIPAPAEAPREAAEPLEAGGGTRTETVICPECGSDVESDARFCPKCSAPMTEAARAEEGARSAGLEPWAVKAGSAVRRVPRWVKIWVPIILVLVVGAVVALCVIAASHSPSAAVRRYLGDLQVGDTEAAYDLLVHPGGKYSSYEYFRNWQDLTTDSLGRLESFSVKERKPGNELFGKLFDDTPTEGYPFVVTLKYQQKSFDVNMTAEDAGGVWPVRRYRVRISDDSTRVLARPLGAVVYVDGYLAGTAKRNKDVEDLLELSDFPSDFSGIVDYVKKLISAFQGQARDVKQLMKDLDSVTGDAQEVFDRFGTSGVSWSDVLNAVESTVGESKALATDIANLIRRIYWMFGGGDDGSLRASLTRVQSEVELENLPEGYHQVKVTMPGAEEQTKEFYAPNDVRVSLKPADDTKTVFMTTMNTYFQVTSNAMSTLNTSQLPTVVGGELLDEIDEEVQTLSDRRRRQVWQPVGVPKYGDITLLSPTVGTIEAQETWNITTYQDGAPVSTVTNKKQTVIYTLQLEKGGTPPVAGAVAPSVWKVVERKVQ